ncbi:hypothetical protein OH77DRAFT_1426710 [Trametes cingulata]|nr:hypothetical protein OH77DRAFT_1426710 [Trametes cingulata]
MSSADVQTANIEASMHRTQIYCHTIWQSPTARSKASSSSETSSRLTSVPASASDMVSTRSIRLQLHRILAAAKTEEPETDVMHVYSPATQPKYRPVEMRDWERGDMVNLEILSYGWRGKCATVRMHLPMDRDIQRLHRATRGLIRDVKHSRNWRCEFCGRFSRETQVQTNTWVSIDPPRMLMFMHHICDHDRARCFLAMEHIHIELLQLDGRPPERLPPPPEKPRNMVYPRAGSCVGCQKDGSLPGTLLRCEGCDLSRYCSLKCLEDDKPRHQETCERICSVTWDIEEPWE